MTDQNRREFLRKLARGAAYSAPAIVTLAAPVDLLGQGMSTVTQHGMGMGGGMSKGHGQGQSMNFGPPPPGLP